MYLHYQILLLPSTFEQLIFEEICSRHLLVGGGRIVNDFQVVIQDAYVRFRNTFTEELFIQPEMDDEFGEAGTP